MQAPEQQAILTITLLAAFADGMKDDRERDEIKRIAESLVGEDGTATLTRIYQDVLLKRVTLRDAAAKLSDVNQRQLAYEMAVCVCDADDALSAAEKQFLNELKSALALGTAQTAEVEQQANALATAPLAAAATTAAAAAAAPAATAPTAPSSTKTDAELDKYIFNHALVNGALELLPQSWASMAIIPLQIKMVYRIGQSYGTELDKGHIKEFIATAGVGLTSQYIEQFGRKLLGGLLGSVAGGIGRGLGGAATGMAFSFASTYALGQLAKRYYAGGRQMNTALLRETYQSMLGEAKVLQGQNLSQIQEKARTLDMTQVMSMVKG